MVPEWADGYWNRLDVMTASFRAATHDGGTMGKDEFSMETAKVILIKNYDIKAEDLAVLVEKAIKTYVGVGEDDPRAADDLDPEGQIAGAFVLGLLTGIRYQRFNDHVYPEEEKADA